MKVRTNYVSNSSSSSFICALTRKPKSADDLLSMLFPGWAPDTKITQYDNSMTVKEVAENVFQQLQRNKFKRPSRKSIEEEFHGRYTFYPTIGCCHCGGEADIEGTWYYPSSRYCRSDWKLKESIRLASIAKEKDYKAMLDKICDEEADIASRLGVDGLLCRWANAKLVDENGKRRYTDKQVKDAKRVTQACKRSKKLKKLRAGRMELCLAQMKEVLKLEDRLAKKDAQNFLDDHKDDFIFRVGYSDYDGSNGSLMEHGDIFRNIAHEHISHH